ncbi:MAG: hypothetical protein ACRD0D_09580 [Acidimicrobiales bacterium]
MASQVAVPVHGDGGRVVGTLCGASAARRGLGDGTAVLLELFARLLGERSPP